MNVKKAALLAAWPLMAWAVQAQQAGADWQVSDKPARIYNTAKQKLRAGKQIFGVTILSPDQNIYCAAANSGFDFTWIEMQHSPSDIRGCGKDDLCLPRQFWRCRLSACRMRPESDIQKATDIGALGIIVPTVDTVEKAQNAVKWAKYPPLGRAAAWEPASTTNCGATTIARPPTTTWQW